MTSNFTLNGLATAVMPHNAFTLTTSWFWGFMLLTALLFSGVSFGQTNDCGNGATGQLTVGSSCNPTTFNSNNDTRYWTSAAGCNAAGNRDDAWGWFVATSTLTTITYNSNQDAILTLLTGTCSPTMGYLACADDNGSGNETITYATTIGTTYRIRIQRYNNNDNMTGTICVYNTPPGPCDSITNITSCGTTINGTIAAGNGTYNNNACGFATPGRELIYTFTPTVTGAYTINQTASGGWVDYMFKVAGTCNGTGWTCIDDLTGNMTSGNFTLTAGTPYYIMLDPETTAGGNVSFTLTCPPTPPVNDNCSGAIELFSNESCNAVNGTTVGATQSQANGCGYADDDVWYSFEATSTEHTVTITAGTIYDIVFEIFASCGSASLGCIDDNFPPFDPDEEEVTLTGLTVGDTYLIRVYSWEDDSFFNDRGTFDICITNPCSPGDGMGTTDLACPSILSGGLGLNGVDPAPVLCGDASGCVEIEATFLELGDTSSYRVESIDYNPPYQFNCLANPVNVNVDDVWSPVVNLPFDFCFYGQTYDSCVIGSNGIISFNTGLANGQSGWRIPNNLPSNINAQSGFINGAGNFVQTANHFFGASIYGVHHDVDPSAGGEIGWELITLNTGCRALVAAWSDVPMFYDPNRLYSGMIVFYENTNVIEVYVENKILDDVFQPGTIWNNGRAQIGIQNDLGDLATTAPGRNNINATWTATNEAWRFVPDGASITTLRWYADAIDPANQIIDPDDDGILEVCPDSTTTYFAEVTYNLCNGGGTLVEVDQTTVTVTGGKVWNGSISDDWNTANNWTPAGVPTPTNCVIIPDTSTINDAVVSGTVNGDGLNLTVQDAGNLLIESNGSLTIVDFVDVQGTGTFHLEDSASLIQVNDFPTIDNNGDITMDRTANIRRTDYVYWSSPVEDFQVQNISTNTPNGFKYRWIPTMFQGIGPPGNLVFGDWEAYNSGSMEVGRGYIVRGPNGAPYNNTTSQDFTATFEGIPNNGLITQPITSGDHDSGPYVYQPTPGVFLNVTNADDNWNLIGNPYPSALDPETFLSYPANSHIEGAIHIWTHNTDIYDNTINVDPFYENFVFNYDSEDYITYNKTGTNTYPQTFNGKIASGQGFFIMALNNNEAGNVTFSNIMRSRNHPNNNFFRMDNSENEQQQTNEIEKHRIWLNLISPDNKASSTLIGYVEGATLSKDRLFDANNLEVNTLNLFSKIEEDRMVIQGRPVPFDINDQVHLGAEIQTTGIYTITIKGVDGLFTDTNQNIFLEDTHLGVIHNLRGAPYMFTVNEPITYEDRFILRFTNETLGIDDPEFNSGLNIISYNNEIKVTSTNNPINTIEVYDMLGRRIVNYKDVNVNEFKFKLSSISNGTFIVKATLYNGQQKVKKIVH